MITAMILAHLVGDYILQWNSLAAWKSRSLAGVSVHCLIVFGITWLFALPFGASFLIVAFIGVLHFLIDAFQQWAKPQIAPLLRFSLDQIAHFAVIFMALWLGGYLNRGWLSAAAGWMHNDALMLHLLAYAFLTMPAWVIIKFLVYGLVKDAPPHFAQSDKYAGIFERLLMATFVLLGQLFLIPFVVAPRLAMEWQKVQEGETTAVYLTELLVSITLAIGIGVLLSLI